MGREKLTHEAFLADDTGIPIAIVGGGSTVSYLKGVENEEESS